MWPLWFVGVMDIATEPVRVFTAKNLHAIADIMGIQQAHILAKSVEQHAELGVVCTFSRVSFPTSDIFGSIIAIRESCIARMKY